MSLGGAQVLPDCEHLHAGLTERGERLDHLLVALAQPDHQPRLGHDLALAELCGEAQHAAGALELGAAAGERVEAGHDLDVVVEDVWTLGDDLRERHLLALEVRGEHLHLASRCLATDLADHADERRGALVGQVVAVDGCDHGMPQAHACNRARHAGRLERIMPGRLAGLDVAEAAAARAGVTEDHEGGGAALPALTHVRAGGLLADRVEVLLADQLGQLAVALAARRRHLEPGRLALAQRPHVGAQHPQHVHAARVGAGARCAHAGTTCGTAGEDLNGSGPTGPPRWICAAERPRRVGVTMR